MARKINQTLAVSACLLLAYSAFPYVAAQAPAPAPAGGCVPLMDLLAISPDFMLITAALKNSSMAAKLAAPSTAPQYTVFAPLDDAVLDHLQARNMTKEQFLAQPSLETLLSYHVLPQPMSSAQFASGLVMPTLLSSSPLTVELNQLGQFSNQTYATVFGFGTSGTLASYDIVTCQAIIHVINVVLLPKSELSFPEILVRSLEDLPFYGVTSVASELGAVMQPGNDTNEVAAVLVGALQAGFQAQVGAVLYQLLQQPNGASYVAQLTVSAIWQGLQAYFAGPLAAAVEAGYEAQVAAVVQQMLTMVDCPKIRSYVYEATYGGNGIATIDSAAAGMLMSAIQGIPTLQACIASA